MSKLIRCAIVNLLIAPVLATLALLMILLVSGTTFERGGEPSLMLRLALLFIFSPMSLAPYTAFPFFVSAFSGQFTRWYWRKWRWGLSGAVWLLSGIVIVRLRYPDMILEVLATSAITAIAVCEVERRVLFDRAPVSGSDS